MFKKAITIGLMNLKLSFREPAAIFGGLLAPAVVLIVFGIIYSSMASGTEDIEIDLLYVDQVNNDRSEAFLDSLESEGIFTISTIDPRYPDEEIPLTPALIKELILGGHANLGLAYEGMETSEAFPVMDVPSMTLYYDPTSDIEKEITKGLIQKNAFMGMDTSFPEQGVDFMLEEIGIKGTPVGTMIENYMGSLTEMWNEEGAGDESGAGDKNRMNTMMEGLLDLKTEEVIKEEVKSGHPVMANMVSGLITMFLLFTVSSAAASLLEEQKEGTVRRLLIAPISVDSIIWGKFISISIFAALQVFIMLLLSALIFHVNVLGNLVPVIIISIATIFACTSFGMIFAALARSFEQVNSTMTIVILTMSAIGGSMFPRIFMPEWMKSFGLLTINGWAIDGYLDALYYFKGSGSLLGYGEAHNLWDVVQNSEAIVLVLFSLICGYIAARIFKRRLVHG